MVWRPTTADDRFNALLFEGRGAVGVFGVLAFAYAHRLTRLLAPRRGEYRATFTTCLDLVRRPIHVECEDDVLECEAA